MLKIEKLDKYFNRSGKNEIHVINETTRLNTMGGLDSFLGGKFAIFIFNSYLEEKLNVKKNR